MRDVVLNLNVFNWTKPLLRPTAKQERSLKGRLSGKTSTVVATEIGSKYKTVESHTQVAMKRLHAVGVKRGGLPALYFDLLVRGALIDPERVSSSTTEHFTPRELEVLCLHMIGYQVKEICGLLDNLINPGQNIADQTVASHMKSIKAKLGVTGDISGTSLIRTALKLGIISKDTLIAVLENVKSGRKPFFGIILNPPLTKRG